MKREVIKVVFLNDSRVYTVGAGGIPLSKGDLVILETPDGLDYCRVAETADECVPVEVVEPELRVLRKATPMDVEWIDASRETEEKAKRYCNEHAAKLSTEMDLVNVKLTFDGGKLIFYYTADKRIDFRVLVKELAKEFKVRIEMRQIGVRDKARRLGGLGICGREICCSTFLAEFEPITMKMAKDQNLTLSPSKISGACGRLLCCLSYEYKTYRELRKGIPAIGSTVRTNDGLGKVIDVYFLTRTVVISLESAAVVKRKPEEIEILATAVSDEADEPELEEIEGAPGGDI